MEKDKPGQATQREIAMAARREAEKVNKVNDEISNIIEKGKQAETELNSIEKLKRRWNKDFDWGGLSFCSDGNSFKEPSEWVCKNDGSSGPEPKPTHAIVTPDEWKLVIHELNKIVEVSAKDYLEMIVYGDAGATKNSSPQYKKYNTKYEIPTIAAYVPWGKIGAPRPDYTQIPKLKLVMPQGGLINVNGKGGGGHIHMNKIELLIIPNVGDYVKHNDKYKKVVKPPPSEDIIARARAGPKLKDNMLHYRQFEKNIYENDQTLGGDWETVYGRLGKEKNFKNGLSVHPIEQIELYIEELPLDYKEVMLRNSKDEEWNDKNHEWVSLSAVDLVKEDDEGLKKVKKDLAEAEAAAEKEETASALARTQSQERIDEESKKLRLAAEAVKEEKERVAAEEAAQAEADRVIAEETAQAEADRVIAEETAQAEADRVASEETAQAEAERLELDGETAYLSRNDGKVKKKNDFEGSLFINYKSSIFSKSIKHEEKEAKMKVEAEIKKAEMLTDRMRIETELKEKQTKYEEARKKHEDLTQKLLQMQQENAGNQEQLEAYRNQQDAEKESRSIELEIIMGEKDALMKKRLDEARAEQEEMLALERDVNTQEKKQEKRKLRKEKKELKEAEERIKMVERSKRQELIDSLNMIKTIHVLDKKYDNLKNNVYCKNIFLNIFKKAYDYIGPKVTSFNWMGPVWQSGHPLPEDVKKNKFLLIMDGVIKEVKEVKEVKEELKGEGADMNIINNYNIFLDCIECIKMISKVKINQKDLESKDSILKFWGNIKHSLNYNTFITYLKIKGTHNNTDDCLLSETQAIPSSYTNNYFGGYMYGGSSYKRTPKKQRKRN